ncbi:MAG: ATP-binding protein [Oligoflexia bacterium]|nr:ATP-binding protein [Oligoflexia bacterium]
MKRKFASTLLQWKAKKNQERMPLVLGGARQVGKTYILNQFGKENYKNIVYVNFEANLVAASYFEQDISPKRVLQLLEVHFETEIIPGETLVIFDEIQLCERALTSLKYFCEDANQYHVVAAGSLLGVAINREKYSFPVGKVEIQNLFPLDFEEFLWAVEKKQLADEIINSYLNNSPLPEVLHLLALDLYKSYLIVGGMPAVILEYVQNFKISNVPNIQSNILNAYVADMAKYASNSESVKIRAAYNSIPAQLAKENKKFQYKVVQKGGTASLFGVAIDWLTFSGVVLKCHKIEHAYMPPSAYCDLSSFKLYMGDVGLLITKSAIAQQAILSPIESGNTFLGAIAENYVAQALHTNGHTLYYWESDHLAEVDFVIQKEEKIIPVEVKAGSNIRSRSLSVYCSKYSPEYAIRISSKNFGLENKIKSVPLYAVFNC